MGLKLGVGVPDDDSNLSRFSSDHGKDCARLLLPEELTSARHCPVGDDGR